MGTNTGRASSENDKETLLCHAKPVLPNLLLYITGIGLGTVFIGLYLGLPASSTVSEYIISSLSVALGTFFVVGGIAMLLGSFFGYPRLSLVSNHLIFVDILGRARFMNLSELGKATVLQSRRMTWLAFFTLEEERALAAKGVLTKPSGLNAAKEVIVSSMIGNDFQRAQELADHINASRSGSTSGDFDAPDPEAVIRNMKRRGRRRLLVGFLILAPVLLLPFLI